MNCNALLAGIRNGNYHAGGIRCMKLLHLEAGYFEELRDEVVRLTQSERGSDVTHPNHVTRWTRPSGEVTQFSLFNTSGRYDDYSSDHDLLTRDKRFLGAPSYPQLAHLVAAIPDLVNFRINLLGARAELSAHEEHSIIRMGDGAVAGRLRFHLPLVTDVGAELTLDGYVYHLEPGILYFINHGCVHSARNGGNHRRIHLVWDALLTRAVYDVMFGDSTLPLPVTRFSEHRQSVKPVRTEPVGNYHRIAPPVTRDEADALKLWSH